MLTGKFESKITVTLTKEQRSTIEERAEKNGISLGEATRDFINLGIEASKQ
jgi:hypothetical protein